MAIYEIDITINDDRWISDIQDIENITKNIIKTSISKIINNSGMTEVSVVLADNNFIKGLNKTYRGKDNPTNVLSFPLTEKNEITTKQEFLSLGDIIIAYETIKSEAQAQNKSFQDHFTHMLVHGCLHLMHYDHITEGDAQEMETLEINILKTMNIKNPYEIL